MKKIAKKIILASLGLLVVASIAISVVAINKRNVVTSIGFYNVPDSYYEAYVDVITKDSTSKLKLIRLGDEDISSKKLTKKIDMLITYNGKLTQDLLSKAVSVPSSIEERFPRTVKSSSLFSLDNSLKIFPINFDLFETNILTTAVNHYDLPLPSFIEDISTFGLKAMEIYPIPIVLSGADDNTLNLFFTLLVEAFGGKEGYFNVKKQIEEDSLNNFYNYVIHESNNLTVQTVLDLIKKWEDESILSRTWRTTTFTNTAQLIEDNRTTMALMTLSEHRNVLSDNLNYYETILFPSSINNKSSERCSIQPCVVGMIFNDNEDTRLVTNRLTLKDNQELLSLKTQMGPSTLQGTAFDRQADDARFFAASFPSGPVPDLATLCFIDKEMKHKMAELIRNY